jgi:manganese transport protein
MFTRLAQIFRLPPHTRAKVSDILRFMGPGLLVTVGFIDPGNWAANVAAGADYGYTLLWMVTLGTIMLIMLQHNAAHLGIVTGDCLAEAATRHLPRPVSRLVLGSAILAAIAFAEILGAGIALQMLTGLPIRIGATFTTIFAGWLLVSRSYKRLETVIIGFVSLIGCAFVVELLLIETHWGAATAGWVTPAVPTGAMPIIMSVLGAVVMPHNLFLHSEVIQSRQWHTAGEEVIVDRLKYEFLDTLFSMLVGWAINSAMILVAAATFFRHQIRVTDLAQAEQMLRPLLGNAAAVIFALALLCAGIASSITAGMAGASIFAGMSGEPYDSGDPHTRRGILLTLAFGGAVVWLTGNPFKGLLLSQLLLSIQLPWTIFLQIYLTSSSQVMGKHANPLLTKLLLWGAGLIVAGLNVMLLLDALK